MVKLTHYLANEKEGPSIIAADDPYVT